MKLCLFSLIHTVIRFTPLLESKCMTCYGIIFYFHIEKKFILQLLSVCMRDKSMGRTNGGAANT